MLEPSQGVSNACRWGNRQAFTFKRKISHRWIRLADSVPDILQICHPSPLPPIKACRKGDPEAKAVTVNESPVRVIADASEITELPRDMFEVHEISKESLKHRAQLAD